MWSPIPSTLRLLMTPRVKLDTMLWLLAPLCFLPLLSPITIAVIPLLAERMLQDKFPNWLLTADGYNPYLGVILVCGTGAGALTCAAVICAMALYLVPRFALGPAMHTSSYQRTAEEKAVNRLGPHLPGRDDVLLWDSDGRSRLYPPSVLAALAGRQFTFRSVARQRQRLALLRAHGYQAVLDRGGFIVLRSPGASAPSAGSG